MLSFSDDGVEDDGVEVVPELSNLVSTLMTLR